MKVLSKTILLVTLFFPLTTCCLFTNIAHEIGRNETGNSPADETITQSIAEPEIKLSATPEINLVTSAPVILPTEPGKEDVQSCDLEVPSDHLCARSNDMNVCLPRILVDYFDYKTEPEQESEIGPDPAHAENLLQGYPISDSFLDPKINIYDLENSSDLTLQEMEPMITELENLIVDQPGQINKLPFLPNFMAAEVISARPVYQDGSCGGVEGVGMLTQFAQNYAYINNNDLIYTFQGISLDKRYWVSIILPIHQADLSDRSGGYTPTDSDNIDSEYFNYIDQTRLKLEEADGDSFDPSLELIQEIKVYMKQ